MAWSGRKIPLSSLLSEDDAKIAIEHGIADPAGVDEEDLASQERYTEIVRGIEEVRKRKADEKADEKAGEQVEEEKAKRTSDDYEQWSVKMEAYSTRMDVIEAWREARTYYENNRETADALNAKAQVVYYERRYENEVDDAWVEKNKNLYNEFGIKHCD